MRRLAPPTLDLAGIIGTRLDASLAELREGLENVPDALLMLPVGTDGAGERSAHDLILASREAYTGPLQGRYALTGTGSAPISIADGIAQVERVRAEVVAEMVAEVERCALDLVTPKLLPAVLARAEVVERWPWPEWATVLDLMTGGYWPGAAAPLEVARWARDKMNGVAKRLGDPSRVGDGLLWDAERGGLPRTWTAEAGIERHRYPAAGLALLYLAERDVLAGLRRPAVAIDAGKEHHALLQGWGSVPRDGVRHRAAVSDASTLDGRVELLLPGSATQLALPLPMEGLSQTAIALLRQLRGAEGLRHWCALQRLLSVEGGRQGWVRWTLDEHLEAMGYSATSRADPEVRASAAAQVETLTKLELVVYDKGNTQRYRAPLLTVGLRFERIASSAWALDGMELQVNPLLYGGVRSTSGEVGSNWMPAPVDLAKLDHVRHPYAHGLGMLLAIRMRWDIGDGRPLRLKGSTLLDLASIPYSDRRAAEAWAKLTRTLGALVSVDLLTYAWDGEPWTLDAVCEVRPAGWIMDRVGRGLVPVERPPAVIPRTGAELTEWRELRGWSQRAAAKRLGVTQQGLSKAEAKRDGELGATLLEALKHLATGEGRQLNGVDPRPGDN